jgi:hypothetical protein
MKLQHKKTKRIVEIEACKKHLKCLFDLGWVEYIKPKKNVQAKTEQ